MSTTIRATLAQVTSGTEPQENLTIIDEQVRAAKDAGSSLVVFPEAMMRCFGGPIRGVAEPLDGPWANAVRDIAGGAGITVVAGMFTPSDDGRVRNTLVIAGPAADTSYDKIHLFDAFGFAESDTVAPGSDPVVITVDGVGIGFATCYDIRFPGLFHALADRGASVIVVPASWGRGPGKVDQWTLLARARALDSTSYVLACDQADPEASGATALGTAPLGVGHSVAVSPTGTILDQLGAGPSALTVDLDIEAVETARKTLPVLANRKF